MKIVKIGQSPATIQSRIKSATVGKLNEINAGTAVLSGAKVYTGTTEYWSTKTTYVPKDGEIIVYTDYATVEKDGEEILVPGVKIGDGNAYVVDLPFVDAALRDMMVDHVNDEVRHVSESDRSFWNNKLNLDINDEKLTFNRL